MTKKLHFGLILIPKFKVKTKICNHTFASERLAIIGENFDKLKENYGRYF